MQKVYFFLKFKRPEMLMAFLHEFYLLPPYSQNGTVPSFCAKYGGLKEYLYSNRLCIPRVSPLNDFIKKIETNNTLNVRKE